MKQLSFLCLVLLVGNTGFAQKIAVSAGQKIHQTTQSNGVIHQTVAGNDMEIKSDITLDADIVVKAVSTDITLTNTITRLQSKTEMMGNSRSFDSDKKEDMDGQMGQVVKDIINKPSDVVLSYDGKVKNTKPTNSSKTDMLSSIVGSGIGELVAQSFLAVPEKLQVGDTFTVYNESKEAGKTQSYTYKVKSINGTDAVLSFSGTENTKTTKTVQGMDAIVTGTSSITGELTVNTATGIIQSKKGTTEGKGTTQVMGQEIPFSTEQHFEIIGK
ncbi:MAG: hypothetical protein KGO81_03295 [Bacteroidota bacterium]|nr:hypothetical protein [Bacteroidota bacterium]